MANQPASKTASPRAFVIALLGAESTGKTTLAAALHAALSTPQQRVAVVDEYLREFCARHGRTPQRAEQVQIAAEQTRRIEAATADHDIVIADTTALMIAVYSEQVFGDMSLYPQAQIDHLRCDLTLLTALDLAWQADGLQRDGPQVREPVDARVRAALGRAGAGYAVIAGSGAARLDAALAAVQRARHPPLRSELIGSNADSNADSDKDIDTAAPRWQWHCERCGDAGCERRSFLPKLP